MCNQCGVVCPVKIPLPDLQRKLREKEFEGDLRPWHETRGAQAVELVRACARRSTASLSGWGVRMLR